MKEADNTILLRKVVRRILVGKPGVALTEGLIVERIEDRFPGERIDISDVRAAIDWNTSRRYLISEINEDIDEREWKATKEGIAKENIS